MNPPAAATPSPTLDPILLAVIVRGTLDTMPHHPDAPAEEQEANRHAAFTMIAALRPRDPLEAMLAARIAAAHFHTIDEFRCAAQCDLPPALKLRHRRCAAALSRMQEAAQRELKQRQASPALQPAALPTAMPAPRPPPAPRPQPAPAATGVPRGATGGFVAPTQAEIAQLVAEVEARQDAKAAAGGRRQAGLAAPRPASGGVAGPSDAEIERLVASAHALLAETAPPAEDMGLWLQAEVAARAAAAATVLAA